MAAEPIEIRMAKLEGAYEQINLRLRRTMERRLIGEFGSGRREFGAVGGESRGEMSPIRQGFAALRREMTLQFHCLVTFLLLSIILPILRDLAR
jgi:hypothetical protein